MFLLIHLIRNPKHAVPFRDLEFMIFFSILFIKFGDLKHLPTTELLWTEQYRVLLEITLNYLQQ